MNAVLLALFSVAPPQSVEGLRAGEHALPIAAPRFAASGVADVVYGRALDATTGAPVQGARIEAWSEDAPQPAMLIDSAITARDGSYVLRREDGGVRAEKLCVRAAGYRWTTRALQSGETLWLAPAPAPLEARVVDVDGRPIAQALFSTRHTCAHEPPANRVRGDALGRLDLRAFPPFADSPEGELQARGFEALRNLDYDDFAAGVPVHLGRKLPLAVRVLDERGQWLPNKRIVLGAEPEWLAAFTDGDGLARFDSCFADAPTLLRVVRDREAEYLGEVSSWRVPQLTLRIDGHRYAPSAAPGSDAARVEIVTGEQDAPWALLHADGWWIDAAGERYLPSGKCALLVGADFSGWREQHRELSLADGERLQLELEPRREPRVLFTEVPAWVTSILLEADSHSRRWRKDFDRITRPANRPCTLIAAGRGRCVRTVLAASESDVTVDIASLAACHSAAPNSGGTRTVRIDAPEALHAPLRVEVYRRGRLEDIELSGAHDFVIDRDDALELWLAAEGWLPRCIVLPPGGDAVVGGPWVASASLSVAGDVARVVATHGEVERADEALEFELTELAPGPLILQVQRGDGAWLALELALQPGERRRLAVR